MYVKHLGQSHTLIVICLKLFSSTVESYGASHMFLASEGLILLWEERKHLNSVDNSPLPSVPESGVQ